MSILDDLDDDPPAADDAAGKSSDASKSSDAAGKDGKKPKGKKPDHKEAILVVLSTVGVLIAYLTYRKFTGAGTPTAGSTTAGTPQLGGNTAGSMDPTASTGTVAGGAMPDASYFQQLQAEIEALQQGTPSSSTSTVPTNPNTPPVATFIYGAPAAALKYLEDLGTGAIYQIDPNGAAFHLSSLQYAELGNPTVTKFGTAPKPPAKPPAKPVPHAPTPPWRPGPPGRTSSGPFYLVHSGDTLSAIARGHNESLATLEKKNPQIANPNLIHPGEHIYY